MRLRFESAIIMPEQVSVHILEECLKKYYQGYESYCDSKKKLSLLIISVKKFITKSLLITTNIITLVLA